MTFSASVRMGFVVDVAGYSRRSAREKVDLQHRVTAFTDEVLADLDLRIGDTHHHGTGDGIVVFLPTEVEVHRALARLLRSAVETLAEDNRRYRDRMRLRMAVVIGPLGPAAIGFSGDAVVEAGRLVDSDALRRALDRRPGADLAVMVSDQLHSYAIRERHSGLSADDFSPVEVETKEYRKNAWLWRGPSIPERARPGAFRLRGDDAPNCTIGIRSGGIMQIHDADVWVNSENTDMEMARINDFSVSSIIRYHGSHRDAGGHVVHDVIADELARAVGGVSPVAPAAAFATGAGALTASNAVRWIVHVAAVQGEPGAGFRQVRKVGACVYNALSLAERLDGATSILVPMLGTGVAGGALAPTATDLVTAAADYLVAHPATRLRAVWFLAYTDPERAALHDALTEHAALRPATG
ncbi:macro domain-containing protein [Catenuloplanes atrovinosus]|uniref:O-acetyl-ADP-ribose deacetylase (Regulator of RNase III) n=1 Tax=Catenuloplanes atrovinosus TaxID=137266 RepID=A0AAE3YNR0_9ACTN|nr:macro domain-containing protein [Catenuloplanes atrovinosus]MDR7276412.1 O-acetyl-ADP-ribose deacetylase (regulator of RNase III) [Catenuloplanes atrovinosus]